MNAANDQWPSVRYPQTDIQLIRAVGIHASRAICLTVARRWGDCESFKKTSRSCQRDLIMLKRNGTTDAHLASATIQELIHRRESK